MGKSRRKGRNWLAEEAKVEKINGVMKICGMTIYGTRTVEGATQYLVKYEESNVVGKREYRQLWITKEEAPHMRDYVNELCNERHREATIHAKDRYGFMKVRSYIPGMDDSRVDNGFFSCANNPRVGDPLEECEFPATYQQVVEDCERIRDPLTRRVALMFLSSTPRKEIALSERISVNRVATIINLVIKSLRRKYGVEQ